MPPRPHAPDPSQMLQYGLWIFAVVTAILIGAAIVQRIRNAYFTSDEPDDVLASLQEAYDAGELDEAEFRRVRDSLERPSGEVLKMQVRNDPSPGDPARDTRPPE